GCAEPAQRWSPSRPSRTIRIWETAPPDPDQLLQREAMNLVDQLFDYYIDRVDVVAYLRRTASFGAGVRQAALAAAEQHRGNPLWLNNLSWRTVSKPDMPPDAYRKALRQAEEAVQLEPRIGYYVNTLGVAQYRVGQYQQALETLTKSDELNRRR